jgi:two-component system, sensor histidine kinase LadS
VTTRLETDDLEIMADRERLRIALVNLLGNAIKYAPPASTVTIDVERKSSQVVIAVHDQGPGVPVAEAKRLFDKHQRGPCGSQAPGLGLGLYIVRRIVELHEGTVAVRNGSGEGAVFSIRLPAI